MHQVEGGWLLNMKFTRHLLGWIVGDLDDDAGTYLRAYLMSLREEQELQVHVTVVLQSFTSL